MQQITDSCINFNSNENYLLSNFIKNIYFYEYYIKIFIIFQ